MGPVKRRIGKRHIMALHVLIEEKLGGVRAHCIEFDLALSAANTEQAMVRIERLILKHINYARENKSNPIGIADLEVVKKWLEPSPSPSCKAWILEIHSGSSLKGKSSVASIGKKYHQDYARFATV